MKKLRDILLTTVVVLAVGVNLMLFAQADVQVLQSADLHAALALMHPLAPEAVPEFGTFYFVSNCEQTDGSPAPAPFNPRPDAPVYSLGSDDVFLVDDTAPKTLITSRNTSGAAMAGDAPSSDDGTADSGTSTDMLQANYSSPVYGSNDLWLEIHSLSNGVVPITVHGTNDGRIYMLTSKTNLTDAFWSTEQAVHMAAGQNLTNITVTILDRTRSLFLWAMDWTGIDSNSNGIPDWWEWENFGNLDQSADGDYDGDGLSNYQEYLRGSDPKSIAFDVNFPNFRVNSSIATGTFSILAGVAGNMAVLVNDTNFADASWMPYSPSVPVRLDSTDGTWNVWIGLKGRAGTSQATWEEVQLTRDTAPPMIVITNPIGTTLSQPVIQLQGYSPEPLSSVRYDITSAAGILTNQQGYVTMQWFDPDLFDFTTNWFQCMDIQLTNGANTIMLYTTDLAGNVGTNTYSYVLDYSTDTNPPVIGLYWPQDGTQVCGTNFTLRGHLDDATAQLVVQTVDTNGVTNAVSGLVERDGDFWVENLPLGTGATQFTVTATDAVGHTSVTNVSVVQNTLVLTIDPLPSDQLNDPTMTVTGTINSTGYTVLVNGVQATVNGNGTWTAQYVPVNGGGTAVVVAQAVPVAGMSASANRESGGTGLLANAQSSPSPQQQTTADKPLTLVMTQYSKDWSFDMTEDDWLWDFESQTVQWNLGQPGNDFWDQCWYTDDPNAHYYSWASDNWDARMYGTSQSGFYRGQDSCGRRDNPSVWQHTISVSLASETCKGGSFRILTDEWDDYYETVNRKVTTRYELRTGAKGTSGRKNLFVLSASAVGLSDLFYPEVDSSSGSYAINPTAIQIGDLGSPWSDGLLCKALEDGETHDATPRVSSARYYTSGVGVGKYLFTSQVSCTPPGNPNLDRTTLGVGENVSVYFNPAPPVGAAWTATAGSLSGGGSGVVFTAPGTGGGATVTANVRSATFPIDFSVIEPSGVTATLRGSADPYNIGVAGAGMQMDVVLQPTTVSFSAVQMEEVGEPASNVTGYFIYHPPPSHVGNGADVWHPVNCSNKVLGPPIDLFDHAYYGGISVLPGPWSLGGFTWPIPALWKVGNGPTKTLPGWTSQQFSLGADGTMMISKLGHTVVRRVNEITGTAQ